MLFRRSVVSVGLLKYHLNAIPLNLGFLHFIVLMQRRDVKIELPLSYAYSGPNFQSRLS